ncbi:MAG: formylglycine-generating enzyme family protein, partial [Candidatus Promineifilaceae bacterium]
VGSKNAPSSVVFTPADSSAEAGAVVAIEEQGITRSSAKYRLIGETYPHDVYVDAFEIQKYEVKNSDYHQCVRSTACSRPANATFEDSSFADYPVTNVTYDQAADYCGWLGGSLPTEAQWEKAARYGYEEPVQLYAWGNEFVTGLANTMESQIARAQPVGQFPQGNTKAGLADMTGNVAEWVYDWYDENYYRDKSQIRNPIGPDLKQGLRITRGGSFRDDWVQARITYRDANHPDGYASAETGFRCVHPKR